MNTKLPILLLLPVAAAAAVVLTLSAAAGPLPAAAVSAPAPSPSAAAAAEAAPAASRAAVPASDAGAFAAAVGTRLSFAFRVQTDFHLCTEGEVEAGPGMACGGSMVVTVVARRPGELLAEVAFAHVASEVPALREALAEVVTVRLGCDGQVMGYRFAPKLLGHHRQIVRDVFDKFRFTIPAAAGATWQADEFDSTGRYRADYRRLAGGAAGEVRVERRKLRYLAMAAALPAVPEHSVEGRAEAVLSPELGWLTSVTLRESTTMALPSMPARIAVQQSATLRLQAADRVAVAGGVVDWDGAWAPAGGGDEDGGAIADEQERAHWRQRLQGVELGALVDELRELLRAGARDTEAVFLCRLHVSWLVRLRPEVSDEIARRVAEGMDLDLAGLLLGAAGSAGTPAAQRLLLQVYGDANLDGGVRDAAAFAMLGLARPEPAVLRALAADVGRVQAPGPLDATALLTLGALAGRSTAVIDGTHTALDRLLALEARAGRGGFTSLWLDALGNSGSGDVLPALLRHLGSADMHVRESAVAALRRVPGEPVVPLLDRASADGEALVRIAAVEALSERPEPDARAILRRVAAGDADEAVREAALQALAPRLGRTAGEREVVERIARSDPSPRVRELAARILAG